MNLTGIDLLDGDGWRRGMDVAIADGRITGITEGTARAGAPIVCPAPIDLQVNGGAGRMLGDCQTPEDVLAILAAHRRLGTGAILPTLISDRRDVTEKVIDLVAAARAADEGILGLHLEGPHLTRAGAHDPARLRDMTEADLADYLHAKTRVGHLTITLAPERVTLDQLTTLAEAGILVSLGHSDCSYGEAVAAFDAGARMGTHLFNAMSGLHHREPGLVGATLTHAECFGIIADGHHVADGALRVALMAREAAAIPVSDAMALAGTDAQSFSLDGREVRREGGRLTLADGTLAGANTSLTASLAHIAKVTGRPLADILPMGFDRPHRLIHGTPNRLKEGGPARLLNLDGDALTGFDGAQWHALS